jgi:hypothetical protein
MNEPKSKWEQVCGDTWRLETEDGYLYRVGAQLAYVPTTIGEHLAEIGNSLGVLADALDELRTLFDSAMVAFRGGRAIRTCDIGRD